MSDLEFDVLDELYFVISFDELKSATELDTETLRKVLHSMLDKGWIKCFRDRVEALSLEDVNFDQDYMRYYYLATKEGLLAHNGQAS
jgi:transcription initiation factor IIE alpha subunit